MGELFNERRKSEVEYICMQTNEQTNFIFDCSPLLTDPPPQRLIGLYFCHPRTGTEMTLTAYYITKETVYTKIVGQSNQNNPVKSAVANE